MTRRAWLSALVVAGFPLSILFAEPGIVKTKDGVTYQGEIKDRGENVVITIHGVDTVIPKSNVASIERPGSYAEDFRTRMNKLDPKDVPGRIALAREAFEKRQYDLSRQALEDALVIDPGNADAARLLETVQSQIRLERQKVEASTASPEGGVSNVPRSPVGGQAAIDRRLLTPTDIAAIRRKELQASDTGVRIRFDGDVKRRYVDNQKRESFADFNARTPIEQAMEILDSGDETLKNKVHVTSDPQSMLVFRRQIQPLVLQNCATSACHGGPSGGGLILFTPADSDVVTYTNFYILQSFAMKPQGTASDNGGKIFGDSQKRLIDRGHGEASLLVNFGLPTSMSQYPHPPVSNKTIAPIFRNKDDARYKMVVNWMDSQLLQIAPDYGIHYTPPAATLPATEPAKGGAAAP